MAVNGFDPFSLGDQDATYAAYKRYREAGCLVPGAEPFPGTGPAIYAFSNSLVQQTLKHPALLQSPPGDYQPVREQMTVNRVFRILTGSMLLSDPPEHEKLRQPLNKLFTPAAVRLLEERLHDQASLLAGHLVTERHFDIVRDFVVPFSVNTIESILGLAIGTLDPVWFKHQTAAITNALDLRTGDIPPEANTACEALIAFVENCIAEQALSEGGLASAILKLEAQGVWTHEDVVSNLVFLLFAGQETVIDAMGNAIMALERHPAERHRLATGEISVSDSIDEFLRFGPPVHFAGARIALHDLVLAGTRVSAGQAVVPVLASANRDESIFADADTLCLKRGRANFHRTFGAGLHICLGQHLARMEMRIMLEQLYRKLPSWRLDMVTVNPRDSLIFRGYTTMMAKFEGREAVSTDLLSS
jgi:cytochrome P450